MSSAPPRCPTDKPHRSSSFRYLPCCLSSSFSGQYGVQRNRGQLTVDNRPLRFAGPAVELTRADAISAAELQLAGRARDEPLGFVARLHCAPDSPAVLVSLWFTNTSAAPIFLRLVTPVTQGLVAPGSHENHRLALGQ